MDHFGIGAAMKGMLLTYVQTSRRSGRTTSLLESLKDGDRVIFSDARHANEFKRLAHERGIKVDCVIVEPSDGLGLNRLGSSPGDGRTILDHTWVEQYYERQIDRSIRIIDDIQKNLSGYGAAHRETKRAAIEIAKWKF